MWSYISIKTVAVMITKIMFNMITKFMVNMITKFMFNMTPVGDHVSHRAVQGGCVGLAGGVGRPRDLGGDGDGGGDDGGDGDGGDGFLSNIDLMFGSSLKI